MTTTLEHQSHHNDGAAYLAQGLQQVRALRVQADMLDADRARRCARIADTYSRVVRRILHSDLTHEQAAALSNAAHRRALERLNAISESRKAEAAAYREDADRKEKALPASPADRVAEGVDYESVVDSALSVFDTDRGVTVRVVPGQGFTPTCIAVGVV